MHEDNEHLHQRTTYYKNGGPLSSTPEAKAQTERLKPSKSEHPKAKMHIVAHMLPQTKQPKSSTDPTQHTTTGTSLSKSQVPIKATEPSKAQAPKAKEVPATFTRAQIAALGEAKQPVQA